MEHKTFAITGIPVPAGQPVPVRREVSQWATSTDPQDQIQVSLFVRAVKKMQLRDPLKNELSFYRIAGIHGLPAKRWNHAPSPDGFYCAHNTYQFPTWHRPYLMLYEQVLHDIMVQEVIEEGISDPAIKATWTAAADTWRLPFWDWAIKQQDTQELGLPNLLSEANVKILKVGDTETEPFDNPLYKFVNRLPVGKDKWEKVAMGDPRMGKYKIQAENFDKSIGTSRWAKPDDSEWAKGKVDNKMVNENIKNAEWYKKLLAGSIADNVARLLTDDYFLDYNKFSSTRYAKHNSNGSDPCATEWLSLEMVHNNIHMWVGGYTGTSTGGYTSDSEDEDDEPVKGETFDGHMANVPVAGFDPVFYLHHANVDRILAIWHFLSDKWINPGDSIYTEDLRPFTKDEQGSYHSSQFMSDEKQWGYTYPELTAGATKDSVKQRVWELYGHPMMHLQSDQDFNTSKDTFDDYIINITYDRYALKGKPYYITFYLEDADESWTLGQVFNFSAELEYGCANCKTQKEQGILSRAQVPISVPLHKLSQEWGGRIRLGPADGVSIASMSLEEGTVVPLLAEFLKWKVFTTKGKEVPISRLSTLEVEVLRAPIPYSIPIPSEGDFSKNTDLMEEGGLPQFTSKYTTIHAATMGKEGGV
ncbi:hypothetical protein ASPZODRAFT_18679 [Penicilliopsis zonata CBS 506.65]|uniref:tyrosinase n=1 Tax=Penicilliopsis zonata CBS 506.65 TaxID=1073090 RepID=A0A1L9SBJ3_9EURO|nr:hypothetical protein ASPZODRAFT_18679 [Penicilliopsis zonata CBS 506.65]OJJ44489.1 hypothetical protein ASPZODRAFT_18679 [Penicilliopsis zonata CBS 506.65]